MAECKTERDSGMYKEMPGEKVMCLCPVAVNAKVVRGCVCVCVCYGGILNAVLQMNHGMFFSFCFVCTHDYVIFSFGRKSHTPTQISSVWQ